MRRAAGTGDKPHSKTKTKKERRGCSTREEVDTGRKGRSRKKQGKLAVKATMLLSFFFCVGQFTKPQGCGGVPVKTGAGCSCRCSNGVCYHDIGGDCGEVAGEGRPCAGAPFLVACGSRGSLPYSLHYSSTRSWFCVYYSSVVIIHVVVMNFFLYRCCCCVL